MVRDLYVSFLFLTLEDINNQCPKPTVIFFLILGFSELLNCEKSVVFLKIYKSFYLFLFWSKIRKN